MSEHVGTSIWWVSQGENFKQERQAKRLWAPLKNNIGSQFCHWNFVGEVKQGDLIVHHADGAVRALSRAVCDGRVAPRPPEKAYVKWTEQGRQVDIEMYDLVHPIRREQVADALRKLSIVDGPIETARPRSKQGYLWRFNADGLAVLRSCSPDPWPDWATTMLPDAATATTTAPTQNLPEEDSIPAMNLDDLLASLRSQGLRFSEEVVCNYLLALQTKRFVLLTGISGTGKTQLALAVARHFCQVEASNRDSVPATVISSVVEHEAAQGYIRTEVLPYHLRYDRVALPVLFTKYMRFPEASTNAQRSLHVHYADMAADLTYYVNERTGTASGTTFLLFKGAFKKWFHQNLKVGDSFYLSVVPTQEDDAPDELRFSLTPPYDVTSEQAEPMAQVPAVPVTQAHRRDGYTVVAVRPDWVDHRGLLGFYNPITSQYQVTPFLRLLLDAEAEWRAAVATGDETQARPYFAILDEMNLARVEHYFADFLSAIESGEPLHLHDSLEIQEANGVVVPRQLQVPNNLFFTGTINVDETTFMFSPKVLDRAFTIEFNDVNLNAYGLPGSSVAERLGQLKLDELYPTLRYRRKPNEEDWIVMGMHVPGGPSLREAVVALNALLMGEHRHFGYRVANEIARFVHLAADQMHKPIEADMWAALDLAILQKVLPKLHGTQQELEDLLNALFSLAVAGVTPAALLDWDSWEVPAGTHVPRPKDGGAEVEAVRLPRTAAKLWRMLRRLHRNGFTSFME